MSLVMLGVTVIYSLFHTHAWSLSSGRSFFDHSFISHGDMPRRSLRWRSFAIQNIVNNSINSDSLLLLTYMRNQKQSRPPQICPVWSYVALGSKVKGDAILRRWHQHDQQLGNQPFLAPSITLGRLWKKPQAEDGAGTKKQVGLRKSWSDTGAFLQVSNPSFVIQAND
jgi:hypothetical protein